MAKPLSNILRNFSDGFWPRSLSRQAKFETTVFAKYALARLRKSSHFRGKRGLLVNVGCGFNVADGYVNVDVVNDPRVFFWDCRKSLPFDNDSVDVIFSEHVVEHFEYPNQSSTFLKECHRCLKRGGVARIIVPDGGLYLSLYNSSSWQEMLRVRPLVATEDGYKDGWLDMVYKTKMEFINSIFRQGTEHKFIYDSETLERHMKDCGFEEVRRQEFGVSASPHPPLDSKARQLESLYVEGIKR